MTIKLRHDQKKLKINSAGVMFRIMREVLLREKGIDKNRERVWVASLAASGTLLNLELVALGGTNSVIIVPSAVFSIALQKDSKGIIIIHNHPSGKPLPSAADDNLTELMVAVGELVKCRLLDHMIIGENAFYSYEQHGKMEVYKDLINAADPRLKYEVERLRFELMDSKEELGIYKKKVKEMAAELKQLKGESSKSGKANKTKSASKRT